MNILSLFVVVKPLCHQLKRQTKVENANVSSYKVLVFFSTNQNLKDIEFII